MPMRGIPVAANVEAWMARRSGPERAALDKLRAQIRAAAPGAEEKISYGMPTFALHGSLVAFGAFKNHLSFFPMSSTLIGRYTKELAGYVTAKGTIQFTPEKPIPAALIKQMVKERIAQNLEIASERVARTTAKKSTAKRAQPKKAKPKR